MGDFLAYHVYRDGAAVLAFQAQPDRNPVCVMPRVAINPLFAQINAGMFSLSGLSPYLCVECECRPFCGSPRTVIYALSTRMVLSNMQLVPHQSVAILGLRQNQRRFADFGRLRTDRMSGQQIRRDPTTSSLTRSSHYSPFRGFSLQCVRAKICPRLKRVKRRD